MRRFLVFGLSAVLMASAVIAAPAKKKVEKEAVQAAPSPSATATATVTVGKSSKADKAKPRWIQWPPVREEARTISYAVNALYRNQGDGDYKGFSMMDLRAFRKIDEYAVTGEGSVRFISSASNTDDVKSVQLRTAKADLSENWFTLSAGRMDVSDQISSMHFFGRYSFESLRRVTGIRLFLPVRFLMGIEDYRNVSSPPTSLSFYYLPNIFSDIDADLSGQQSFFLANARARVKLQKKWQTVLLFNYGKSKSNYFQYSTINGSGTASASAEVIFDSFYSAFGEFGIQNTGLTSGTEVAALGLRFQRIGTFGPFSIDDIIFETQLPIKASLDNPFTGGNPVFSELGSKPSTAYYVKIQGRVHGVFFEADGTTSVNDYTFARLNHSNINSLLFPLPVGGGLETDGLEFPFSANNSVAWATMFRIGILF